MGLKANSHVGGNDSEDKIMTCQMVYYNGNCLNTKKPFAQPCQLCIERCPHQAISEYRQLDAKQCTECGVCMAVCPSDGFADRTMDNLHDFLIETEKIVLNCPKARPLGFEIPCLGIFDRDSWMTLAILAKEKSVTIMTGVCSDCDDRLACATSVQIFKQVHLDWPEHPLVHIQVHSDEGSAIEPEPAVVAPLHLKRKTKSGWRQMSKEKMEEWLPSLAGDDIYPIPKSRQWLIEVLGAASEEKIPFRALTVSDSCTSCGVCAAICPQGALQKREEMNPDPSTEELNTEDKIQKLRLILEPQKCVHCQRCVETCPPKALSFKLKSLSHRLLTGKILIHEGQPGYCIRCGKRIFDKAELCLVCATSNPDGRGFFSN